MTTKSEIRTLNVSEIQAVAGGYVSTINTSGMPSRDQACGTIWILNRILTTVLGKI